MEFVLFTALVLIVAGTVLAPLYLPFGKKTTASSDLEALFETKKMLSRQRYQLFRQSGPSMEDTIKRLDQKESQTDRAIKQKTGKDPETIINDILTSLHPEKILCPGCHQPVASQDRFCSQCGTRLDSRP
jgi:hypothetical protein